MIISAILVIFWHVEGHMVDVFISSNLPEIKNYCYAFNAKAKGDKAKNSHYLLWGIRLVGGASAN